MTIRSLPRCCHFPAASSQACQPASAAEPFTALWMQLPEPSLVLFENKKSKNKKAIRNCQISMKGRKLLLFSFKSWLAEYLPALCMLEFKQRRQIPTRKGNTAMPLPHWASSVFCYNWMKGRFSSCATSDLQSNSNERGKGGKRTGKNTNLCHHGPLANSAPYQNLTCGHLPFCLSPPAQYSFIQFL